MDLHIDSSHAPVLNTWDQNQKKIELYFDSTTKKIFAKITDKEKPPFFIQEHPADPFSGIVLSENFPVVREFSKVQAFFQSVYPKLAQNNLYFPPTTASEVDKDDEKGTREFADEDLKNLREAKEAHQDAARKMQEHLEVRTKAVDRFVQTESARIASMEATAKKEQAARANLAKKSAEEASNLIDKEAEAEAARFAEEMRQLDLEEKRRKELETKYQAVLKEWETIVSALQEATKKFGVEFKFTPPRKDMANSVVIPGSFTGNMKPT